MGIYLYFLLSPSQFPVGPSKISHSKSSQNKLNEEMIKIFNPSNIYQLLGKIINTINVFIVPLIIISTLLALVFSPEDYIQGNSVRIMYVHVPSSWIALMCFATISFCCILNFLFKIKNVIIIYKSLAPIGLLLTVISLVTGSLWGQPTWGTWWAWDARLTSMLLLLFFYCLFIFSYKLFKSEEKSQKICTFVSVLGLINLFLIKYSVDWWSTLHQPSSIKIIGSTTVHSSMLLPLYLMLLVFFLYCALIFLMKYKIETIRVKKKGLKRL